MTHHAAAIALNPITIYLIWGIVGVSVAYANFKSVTEAWAQASAVHPRKNWRFALSFLAREQVCYAKRIPMLLGIALVCCAAALFIPFA